MILPKILFKFFLVIAAIALPMAWLVTTNTGLNTILTAVSVFAPVQFNYAKANGKIIGQPIEIQNLALEYRGKRLNIGKLTLDWQFGTLAATKAEGISHFLPHAEIFGYQDLLLDHVYAHTISDEQTLTVSVQTTGKALQAPIVGNLRFSQSDNTWDLKYALLQIGANTIHVKQKSFNDYQWAVHVIDPQSIFTNSSGNLNATGSVKNLHATPEIKANIESKYFTLNNYCISKLHAKVALLIKPQAPLSANITADKLEIDQHILHDIKIMLNGDMARHSIVSSAIYNLEPIIFNTVAKLQDGIWTAQTITFGYKQEYLQGTAKYNLQQNTGRADLHGKLFNFPTQLTANMTDLDNMQFKLNMHASPRNFVAANLKISNYKLEGGAQIVVDDIAFLMQWMPEVTRLKGKFNAKVNITGTPNAPEITSNAHLTNITATFPSIGVKIKPMELHLVGDKHGKFNLHGYGKMRNGSGEFTITGHIEPFKETMPNSFTIIGTKVEFINNDLAHLIASNTLNIHYAKDQHRLDITGNIEVHDGNVTIPYKRTQTVKSKDVVFVNEIANDPKYLITINPDINIRIDESVHFNGFGLDANVSGKLNIMQRHNALYGNGRVTIKEGTYQLPGQKLLINHGRLLYPSGTLLVNPMLDIKMLGKDPMASKQTDAKTNLELIVQGTAQKPVITESGLTGNKDRALSQALLTGSGMISKNLLQDKLKISEIGLSTRDQDHVEFFDDPSKDKNSLKNKDVVIGRSLGRKFYIQYLHSIGEANKRVRLKYSLNSIWSIGIESGTEGGGADLSFAIERD